MAGIWQYRNVPSPDPDRLVRIAYEAHRHASSNSNPAWEEAGEEEQQAWRAAVTAITDQGDATISEGVPTQAFIAHLGDETHIFHRDFTLGRQGNLVVNDEHASGHHALILPAHGLWYVEDLGSTNGTWLNGRRIMASQRLKKGDKIRIGRTTVTVVSA
jgi:hypothetical protein